MDACIYRWVATGVGVHFAYDGQSGMKIGETARRQAAASGGELEEQFSLLAVHVQQYVDEAQEARTVTKRKKNKSATLLSKFNYIFRIDQTHLSLV